MMKWDIYIADVPFEDLPETKLRPVVVLEDSVILIDCLKMTSQATRPGEKEPTPFGLKHSLIWPRYLF